MREEKTQKSWNLFYLTGYFINPLKTAINHFFFNRSFCSQDFVAVVVAVVVIFPAGSQHKFCFLMSG